MTSYKKSPTRLYKDPHRGKIMGVCAGIAEYLDIKVGFVRIIGVLGIFAFGPLVVIGYLIMGFALDAKPADLYEDEREEEFWKQTRRSPDYTTAEMRRRFRDIERRASDLEAYMTSKRFRLDRELRALED